MPKTCTLAIDVGGTFTDITFADAATGAAWVAKTPSTPGDLSAGFITAVPKALALAGPGPADVLRVFHGTTTATTNAILEGKTPLTALNAAVMPPVSRYVGALREALDAEGVQAPLLIMKSDGLHDDSGGAGPRPRPARRGAREVRREARLTDRPTSGVAP